MSAASVLSRVSLWLSRVQTLVWLKSRRNGKLWGGHLSRADLNSVLR